MSERELLGLPAAGGVAVGRALVLRDVNAGADGSGGETEGVKLGSGAGEGHR